jgi:glycerate kinase
MKFICAPDSFKESLSAADAAAAMARGIRAVLPDAVVECCPIADGGEGTVDAMLAATAGQRHSTRVAGPLGEPVNADWGMLGQQPGEPRTAVMEMAAAAGLALVPPDRRDPARTTTRGVGELIRAALDAGARKIVLGIGGSATNDGGSGCAQALGVRFINENGQEITEPMSGGALASVVRIDMTGRDPRLRQVELVVACDVTNPMTGERGASAIYGPQKGATPAMVQTLDANLRHLARLFREQLQRDVEQTPGAGAAGGLGAGLLAMLDATLRPGVELVLSSLRFEDRCHGATWCFTGEGRIDGQSLSGKACLGVAHASARQGVKTVALVGSAGPGYEAALERGLHSVHVIAPDLPRDESMRRAAELIEARARQVTSKLVR